MTTATKRKGIYCDVLLQNKIFGELEQTKYPWFAQTQKNWSAVIQFLWETQAVGPDQNEQFTGGFTLRNVDVAIQVLDYRKQLDHKPPVIPPLPPPPPEPTRIVENLELGQLSIYSDEFALREASPAAIRDYLKRKRAYEASNA